MIYSSASDFTQNYYDYCNECYHYFLFIFYFLKNNYFEPDIPKVCDMLIPNSQWSVLRCAAPEVHRNVNFRDLHRHQLAAAKKAGWRHPGRSVCCWGRANGLRHRNKGKKQRVVTGRSPGTCSLLCGRVLVSVPTFDVLFSVPRPFRDFFSIKGAAVNFADVLPNFCVEKAPNATNCPLCWAVKPSWTHWDLGVYTNLDLFPVQFQFQQWKRRAAIIIIIYYLDSDHDVYHLIFFLNAYIFFMFLKIYF